MKVINFKVLKDTIETTCVCENEQEWQNILNQARRALATNLEVKGFRKGEVPVTLVDKYVKSGEILKEAMQIGQTKCYKILLKERDGELVDKYRLQSNKLDKVSFSEFQISHIWQKLPSVKLSKWKDFTCQVNAFSVDDAEVKKQIDELRHHLADFVSKKAPASKGDYLLLNYHAEINNKKEPTLVGEKSQYQLGNDKFGSGFDQNLLSISTNEKKDFVITLPLTYPEKKIAGQKVKFNVEVIDVQIRKPIESDEQLVTKLASPNVKTFQDLKKLMLESLQKNKWNEVHSEVLTKIWPKIIESGDLYLPEKYLNEESKVMKERHLHDLKQKKETLFDYLKKIKKTEKEFDLEITNKVKKMLTDYLIIKEIATQEKINIEKKEIDDYYQFLAKNEKKPLSEMKKKYPEVLLFNNLLRYKIEQFLVKNTVDFNNNISDKTDAKSEKPRSS